MKKLGWMKKAVLPALAAVLVLSAAAGESASYFTTYVTAEGGYTLELRNARVEPHESVDANTKSISVENTGEVECYVRVRVVSGSQIPVTYTGAGWTDGGDGYWYYGAVVQPGESTGVLKAAISLPTESETKPIPKGTEINVIVLSECAKVLYDDDGAAKANGPDYEGWTLKVKEG